ncbi:hypothetical protein FB45DRAFT_216177 [Roridomyces roridus]|uniref:DUF6534 domain-containing protein n=1 Tax=Roridomyces roridus TaxID=1738132 RepID=A0AAD7BDA3_9AGAR|nr:hypothetical protein FB45DRAFT_216177 [Roridomyces roridus]
MSTSARLTGEALRLCMQWLGPWLVGACVDLFLQGILSCQFVNYFTWYRDDKVGLRIFVAVLVGITILESIHAFAIAWIQSIVYFGDLDGAINAIYTAWWMAGTPMMVACIDIYVQSYFCYRLWAVSKRWYVVVPICVLFVFALIAMAVGTYFIHTADSAKINAWFAVHLSSVFAGDFLLTLSTAWFLIKSRKNAMSHTADLITSLIRLTFQTAAPAAICAMFNLVFSQKNPGGSGIISTAFNMALPKLYAISMMYTLNARRTISAQHSSHKGMTTTSNEISGGRSRATRRRGGNDMELGQIQVITQTETTQQIDVRDMFDPTAKNPRSQAVHVDTKKSDDDSSVQYSK